MRPMTPPLQPLDVDLGDDVSTVADRGDGANAIISPDGTRLVYLSHSRLFTRRLDQTDTTELPGTVNAHAPSFSPDGQSVAFFGAGGLKEVSIQTGQVISLCQNPQQNQFSVQTKCAH
jgi:hypothetical protein